MWYARRDSNPRPSESESDTLSSCATGVRSCRFVAGTVYHGQKPLSNIQTDGLSCLERLESSDIEEPLMQRVRWIEKVVDELAKGWTVTKIMRLSCSLL